MRTALCVLILSGLAAFSACGDESETTSTASQSPSPHAAHHHCPFGPQRANQTFDTREMIGLDLDAAKDLAAEHGCEVRVSERDGEGLLVTSDSRFDRVDVAVEGEEVIDVYGTRG
jgi:hypothetical protein